MTHAWNAYSGPAVITGAWTTACKTADLSSIVGAQSVVVFIEVQGTFGSNSSYAIMPNGDPDDWLDTGAGGGGKGAASSESTTGYSAGLIGVTDSNGVLEYCGENKSANGFLLGWFVPTDATKRDVLTGAMPAVWTSRSLPGGPDPEKDTLMLLKYKVTANTDYIAVREEGSSDEFLATSTAVWGGVSVGGNNALANIVTLLLASYEANSWPYEHISGNAAGGPATVDCDIIAFEEENFVYHGHPVNDLVFETTDASGSWVDVDLSHLVGVAYAFVLLKVEHSAPGSFLNLAARPKGATQDWRSAATGPAGTGCCQANITNNEMVMIAVPTGPGGHVEIDFSRVGGVSTIKVTLAGSISEEEVGPPVVTEPYPSGNFVSVNNPEKISFVVSNFYGVVKNTIDLKARDPIGKETQIISNGVFQGDFSGFIAEVGVIVEGNNTKVYVQVDEFDELLLTREWTFIVDAENTLGVPI
jgi:hypothetical protein